MTTLLAIDSATDALSLALSRADDVRSLHRVMPRQHQQQLFACLNELLDGQAVSAVGLDAIVYGRGPGSFTGLRIAASAAQGLAFSLAIPVIGVSTLETQVRSFLRREGYSTPALFLSTIDARIGQTYAAFYYSDGDTLLPVGDTLVAEHRSLRLPGAAATYGSPPLVVIGSGFSETDTLPPELGRVDVLRPDILPEARDMLSIAGMILEAGGGTNAAEAIPDYVQKRIGWKTLAEQGRRA